MEKNYVFFHQKVTELLKEKKSFVMVTLVKVRGSAPQNVGAKMIVSEEGIVFGTVGGGKIEKRCLEVAASLRQETNPSAQTFTWNLQKDIGMTCGGEVSLFFEPVMPEKKWTVAVFGAGHVAQALVRLLLQLDCQVYCIDPRPEWLGKLPPGELHPQLTTLNHWDVFSSLPPHTFIVLMTMGHATDLPLLQEALTHHQFPYVGMMGSLVKRKKVEHELRAMGVTEEKIESFLCPIGEKIGNHSPVEIAISVVAQLLKYRDSLVKIT